MAYTSRFNFIGKPSLPREASKLVSYSEKNGRKSAKINFMVKQNDRNGMFVELFDGYQADGKGKIMTMDVDNAKIEIPWKDRFDEECVKMVAGYKKFIVNLGERKEFLSGYDMIQYLETELPKVEGNIEVVGTFKKDAYKGEYYPKFIIQEVRLSDETPSLKLVADIYFNKESFDDSDLKETKVARLNGYLSQYINKDEGTKYVPHQFVLNCRKLDFENPEQTKKYEFYKTKLTTKAKTYLHEPWEMNVYRGAEEIEWDESMLTKAQKEQIEFGLSKAEDFRPKGNMNGSNVIEFRLVKRVLGKGFEDGAVDTGLKSDEFEEQIYVPQVASDESLAKVQESNKANISKANSISDEELFG